MRTVLVVVLIAVAAALTARWFQARPEFELELVNMHELTFSGIRVSNHSQLLFHDPSAPLEMPHVVTLVDSVSWTTFREMLVGGAPPFYYYSAALPAEQARRWLTGGDVENNAEVTSVMLWVSSSGSSAASHYDLGDNRVFQTFGSKHWKIWYNETLRVYPRLSPHHRQLREEISRAPDVDLVLNPGDSIHVPPFSVHQVECTRDSLYCSSVNLWSSSLEERNTASLHKIQLWFEGDPDESVLCKMASTGRWNHIDEPLRCAVIRSSVILLFVRVLGHRQALVDRYSIFDNPGISNGACPPLLSKADPLFYSEAVKRLQPAVDAVFALSNEITLVDLLEELVQWAVGIDNIKATISNCL